MSKQKIGLIGLGAMGKALADKMLEQDISLGVWNRSKDKTTSYTNNAQVIIHPSPASLIDSVDVVILMITDFTAIKETLENVSSFEGKTIIQMGTISPSESVSLHEMITQQKGTYFEAPLLGSIPDIKAGKLIMMIGGEDKNLSDWKWLFSVFGPNPLYVGAIGHASTLKLSMNQLIGSLTCAFSASLALILKKDINLDVFMQVVRDSALYAPTFDKKLDKMLGNDFKNGNFSTKHLLKDLNLFIQELESYNIETRSVVGSRDIAELTVNDNKQDDDYSAVFSTINRTA